ncbi:DUF2971 domain-containing protein [Profundibacter sp.]
MVKIDQLLNEICFPYLGNEITLAKKDDNFRFAHYTSADTAIKIIQNEAIWMRNARVMNDYSEIIYGQKLLEHAWSKTKFGKELKKTLNDIDGRIVSAVEKAFDNSLHDRLHETYITSLIYHDASCKKPESKYGRLSMWRAYGGETNVAFIFHPQQFFTEAEGTNLYISPVFYADKEGFSEQFAKISDGFREKLDLLKNSESAPIVETLLRAFHFATLSTKHPGFGEEKEWRVLYSPSPTTSSLTEKDTVTIGGVPQIIHKINLLRASEKHPLDTSLPTILDKIIIGPCQNPEVIRDALLAELIAAHVKDAHDKIIISDIPLRRNS